MRSVTNSRSYKKRLLISTALTVVFLFSQSNPVKADPCQEGLNSGDCTLSGTLSVTQITADNINTNLTQEGALTITGTTDSTFNGAVYLDSLSSENNTLNITGSLTSGTVSLKNVNSSQSGTLILTGDGASTITGNVYLTSLSTTGAGT